MAGNASINRRDFLKVSSATLAGLTAGAGGMAAAESAPVGMKSRALGKTGIKVSEIGMGTVNVGEAAVIQHAFDKGITLFHTSAAYSKGRSIQVVGEAIKNMKSKRAKMIIAIKNAKLGDIDEDLKTLNTDYVDLYIQPMEANSLANPDLPEIFDKLKKAGKVRFCGYTNHKGVADSIEAALKIKCIEVILATYNLPNREMLDPLLRKAKTAGIGFLAMKTRTGVPKGEDTSGAVRTILQHKDVDSILVGQATIQDVDKAVLLSTKKMTMREQREVQEMMLAMTGVCGSCGRCEGVCPKGVVVPDVFRFRMYAARDEAAEARVGYAEYRRLARAVSARGCDGCGACEGVCPNAVPIRERLKEAHAVLA